MNNKKFEINDILYAVINQEGINRYHQFARVDNISSTGRCKISMFTSIQKGEKIIMNGITYIQVIPNIDVINKVKLINRHGYQPNLNCVFDKHNNNDVLYDIQK